ncbi:Chloroplast sensor kinase, chloroplastic [Sesamum angolense]|uniref:Chloroplast sensor kinase, chloroplastic n=1 Tax=Sesamum angolense TaxID=2727404 RepID=A0AAE1X0S7_9LAMI|nr:Chloroplast sensor kinase, chloroplastic [Sesamum angolense]
MLIFTFPPQTPFPNYNFAPLFPTKPQPHSPCRATANTSAQRPLSLAATASTSLREVSFTSDDDASQDGESMVSSAAAVAEAIRAASTSPVEFLQRIEEGGGRSGGKSKALVLPSQDFQRLCLEQLDLFRRIVDSDALLSVYVRPAGSYVMDRLELRRITLYPGVHATDIVAEFFPELGAVVFPMKAMLLQQSSWQNNVRMSNLVEQIRGSLSSVRTLSKMLSLHLKRTEISYDIVEDILVQGDHMRDTLQQLQDAVYLTKANIMRYNNETVKKMRQSSEAQPEMSSQLSNSISVETSISKMLESRGQLSVSSVPQDSEFPMPPVALAPSHQQGIRLRFLQTIYLTEDRVFCARFGAIRPLAQKQQRVVELCDLSRSFKVAVEEPALRQALSNLIEGALLRTEVGGRIEIVCTEAPAGGALVIIDDDGPDMHFMSWVDLKLDLSGGRETQMHSLTPFGLDLCAEDRIEDNITWNFVAGLTVAREILENYGCVVRVISPRTDAAFGAGGTRLELWLPSFSASSSSDAEGFAQEA